MDTLVFCRFYRDFYLWDTLEEIIPMVTGLPADKETLRKKAKAIARKNLQLLKLLKKVQKFLRKH